MDIVNERSTSYLSVSFRDKQRQLAAPTVVTYRIDCLTTGTAIKAWTAIAAAAQIEIVIAPAENAMLGSSARERRKVTVVATYGVGDADQVTDEFEYDVRNLEFVS